MTTTATQGDRRLRLLARAYPAWWRAERGDELVGTIRELLDDGARLGWSLALDIVLGGLRTRLREHPPLGAWLAYALLDRSLPERWRPWMRRDLLGRGYVVRLAVSQLQWMLPILIVLLPARPGEGLLPPRWFITMLVITLLLDVAFAPARRRRALKRHGFSPDGRDLRPLGPPAEAWPTPVVRPHEIYRVTPWLITGGAVGVLLAVLWQLVLASVAPAIGNPPPAYTGPLLPGFEWKMWVATGMCVGVSLLVSAVAVVRLPSRLAGRTATNRGRVVEPGRFRLGAVVGGAAVVWGIAALLRYRSAAVEPYTLAFQCVVLLFAPAALAAGVVARRVERRGGLAVPLRDVVLGVFGTSARISDHPPARVFRPAGDQSAQSAAS
jgi:hypothetical protein